MTTSTCPEDRSGQSPSRFGVRPGSASGNRSAKDVVDAAGLPKQSQVFLTQLVQMQLVGPSSVGSFLRESAAQLNELTTTEGVGNALIQAGLLTTYQLDRILTGETHGLLLGNYRVLERLGAGSMGVVYLAEHSLLKRRVAVKVLPVDENLPSALQERFYAEMCVLADLRHPNIVMAFDAGRLPAPAPGCPALHYLVMELVPGGDIEQYVIDHGVLPIAQACNWIRQAACGLQEAHDHHLIHRDLKPSNLLLAAGQATRSEGLVKLVDFGLARRFASNLTDPSCLLGSIEFMSPEQSFDPSAVDSRTDIYGLGASLFWMLSGQAPYPEERSLARALRALQFDRPRRLRDLRPDAPPELDNLIDRMLARDPSQRPALPVAVMNALTRFAAPDAAAWGIYDPEPQADQALHAADRVWRVLVVDSDPSTRGSLREALEPLGCEVGEAENGEACQVQLRTNPHDLVLIHQTLPDIAGHELCRRLRDRPPQPHLKILLTSEPDQLTDLSEALSHGADDLVLYPLELRQLAAKLQYLLRLKDAQDRTDQLAHNLLMANRQLEDSLQARTGDVRQAHDALLFAMAKMAESREGETAGHCRRLQKYCRALGEQLASDPTWSGVVNGPFLDLLERCVPLHDIGKLGLPDALLNKPGALDASERALMQTHTLIGAAMLDALSREYGESLGFLAQATIIVRYHHERYDGEGYPDRLAGDAIPPAARIAALADVYDALRRKRVHKPALSHEAAVRHILNSDGQFDPTVLQAFESCQEKFDQIYRQIRD